MVGRNIGKVGFGVLVFAATENACGWGTNIGPIWLVLMESGRSRLVLRSSGYAIFVAKVCKADRVLIRSSLGGRAVLKDSYIVMESMCPSPMLRLDMTPVNMMESLIC